MFCPLLKTVLVGLLLAGAGLASGAGFDRMKGVSADDDLVSGLLTDMKKEASDLDWLPHSVWLCVADWPGVEPIAKRNAVATGEAFAWKAEPLPAQREYGDITTAQEFPLRLAAKPKSAAAGPISARLAVPADGVYRLWFSYPALRGKTNPFRVDLSGANTASHTFGALALGDEQGSELEGRFPIRFETAGDRELPFTGPSLIWEYADLTLKKGMTDVALTPLSPGVLVECLFLSRSKSFPPSRNLEKDANTLTRHYLRYRYAGSKANALLFSSFIVYQWTHHQPDFDRHLYYGSVGAILSEAGKPAVPAGAWSAWVDATESMTSTGPYATDNLAVTDAGKKAVADGTVEIQLAWRPDSNAVLRTIRCPVSEGRTRYSLPTERLTYEAPAATNAAGAWGVRSAEYVARFRSEPEMLETVYGLIAAANLQESTQLPERIKFITSCRVLPGAQDELIPHLKKVGFNWLVGAKPELVRKHGLHPGGFTYHQSPGNTSDSHDPLDPTFEATVSAELKRRKALATEEDPDVGGSLDRVEYVKMGDEIGPVAPASFVNGLADCRLAFQAYLAGQLKERGEGPGFLGVTNLAEVEYRTELPPDAGRAQRRAYYFSRLYQWLLTDDFYVRYTRALKTLYPNALSWCNYTPGSFMHGGVMSSSDWFALSRGEGVGLAWGEDWLWGEQMAGVQTVGYYGAIVECAARKRKLPQGFFVVGRTGSLDRKALMLIARGHTLVYFYDWGPEFSRGAIDTFSHVPATYAQIGRVARAVGPADLILAEGKREPAKVALLYNQTQEFWRGAWADEHFDRLLTYLALQHAHLPVDVIVEEDLTAEGLKPYGTVFVQGLNMTRAGMGALADWVKAGGVLAAAAGTGMYDEFNEPSAAMTELAGVRQRLVAFSEGDLAPKEIPAVKPIDTLTLKESALTPAVALPVVGPKVVLESAAADAEVVGTYADGSAGAVVRSVGKGQVLLLGVLPGHLYRHNAPLDANGKPSTYTAERRAVIEKPARAGGGEGRVVYSEPLTEAILMEHESGLAVTLADFSEQPGKAATLAVTTARPVKEVVSTLRGPLVWKRDGDRVVVDCPVPETVDVIILR
jgi:hypothetical protein